VLAGHQQVHQRLCTHAACVAKPLHCWHAFQPLNLHAHAPKQASPLVLVQTHSRLISGLPGATKGPWKLAGSRCNTLSLTSHAAWHAQPQLACASAPTCNQVPSSLYSFQNTPQRRRPKAAFSNMYKHDISSTVPSTSIDSIFPLRSKKTMQSATNAAKHLSAPVHLSDHRSLTHVKIFACCPKVGPRTPTRISHHCHHTSPKLCASTGRSTIHTATPKPAPAEAAARATHRLTHRQPKTYSSLYQNLRLQRPQQSTGPGHMPRAREGLRYTGLANVQPPF